VHPEPHPREAGDRLRWLKSGHKIFVQAFKPAGIGLVFASSPARAAQAKHRKPSYPLVLVELLVGVVREIFIIRLQSLFFAFSEDFSIFWRKPLLLLLSSRP